MLKNRILAIVAMTTPVLALATDPEPINWATQATSVKTELLNVLTQVVPVGLAIMALFMAPRIVQKLIRSFAK